VGRSCLVVMTGAYTPSYETPGVLVVDMTRSLADPAVESSFEIGRETAERNGWPLTADLEANPDGLQAQYEVLPSLEPERSVVLTKRAPSAFFGTMLQTYLAALGVRRLIVCGMMTSGCVRATVVDEFSHNYRVVLPRECVADHREELHERTLDDLDGRYAFVRPLEDVLEQIR